MVIGEVFRTPAARPADERGTTLEVLQAGIASQVAVLDDRGITGVPGWSSSDSLGIPAAQVAETLAGHLLREIVRRGNRGGALEPLANQLGHDRTYLQGLSLASKVDRLDTHVARMLAIVDRTAGRAYGRPTVQWNPVDLGVRQVIGGGKMPPYIERAHDGFLRSVLEPSVPESRLIVVRGGSSTGKSRAAYEAVVARLGDWRLDYPLTAAALKQRLDAGIPDRTVLWLGELRQYADTDEGPEALGRLGDVLDSTGIVIITTMWHEHWNAYTKSARSGSGSADPATPTGRLLERLPELSDRDPRDPIAAGARRCH